MDLQTLEFSSVLLPPGCETSDKSHLLPGPQFPLLQSPSGDCSSLPPPSSGKHCPEAGLSLDKGEAI